MVKIIKHQQAKFLTLESYLLGNCKYLQLCGHKFPSEGFIRLATALSLASGMVASGYGQETVCWRPALCRLGWGSMSNGDFNKWHHVGGVRNYRDCAATPPAHFFWQLGTNTKSFEPKKLKLNIHYKKSYFYKTFLKFYEL